MEPFAIGAVILALIIVKASVVIVPQGFEFTVERFGRYTKTLKPGLAFIIPMVHRVGRKQNMMEKKISFLFIKDSTYRFPMVKEFTYFQKMKNI